MPQLQTVVQFAKQQYASDTTWTSQKAELLQTAAYAKVQKPCILSHSVLSCWQLASSLTHSVGEIFIAASTSPPPPPHPHPQSCRQNFSRGDIFDISSFSPSLPELRPAVYERRLSWLYTTTSEFT
jgi:hypothetical protein